MRKQALLATVMMISTSLINSPSFADTNVPAIDHNLESEQLSGEVDKLRNSLNDFSLRIQNDLKSIDKLTDAQSAERVLSSLQGVVGETLVLTADNGPIPEKIAKVIAIDNRNLAELKSHGLPPSQEKAIGDRFAQQLATHQKLSEEITAARSELTLALKFIQKEQLYFLDQARVEDGDHMTAVMQDVLLTLKRQSDVLHAQMSVFSGV